MGTLTALALSERAWTILGDDASALGVRWPVAEAVRWLSDGQREVIVHLPSAFTKTAVGAMVAGTRQTLAGLGITDGVQFLELPRNMASDGTTPGRSVTVKPRAWIDEQRPGWHGDQAGEIVHVFFNADDPKTFYHWPPVATGAKAEIVYSATPPELASKDDVIALDDVYANALQYYLLFRAFSKNRNSQSALAMASAYYQLFLQSLGVKGARSMALDINRQMLSDGAGVAGPKTGAPA